MKPAMNVLLMPSIIVLGLTLSACQKPTTDNSAAGANDSTMTAQAPAASSEDSTLANSENQLDSNNQAADDNRDPLVIELSKHRWTLVDAKNPNQQPINELLKIKDQVMLNFNQYHGQDSLNFSVGCNTMSSAYQLNGQMMTLVEIMSTKMLCDDLNDAENKLTQLMQGQSQIEMIAAKVSEPTTLTLTSQDGSTLIWSGKLTAQAKYNSKGETIFWAVSADTKPCKGDATKECLQVKPITYNEEGIKTGEGNWSEFAGTIDGYQHDLDNDEVLRLQRYKTDDKGADKDGYAYVLDTVIEKSVKNADRQ